VISAWGESMSGISGTLYVALLVLVLLVVAVITVVVVKKGRLLGDTDKSWPFYARKLLSQPEQVLYHRLVSSLPEHIVLAQVQVSRILGVKKGFNFHQWNNRINRLSYDFVVCSKDSTVVAAIELDDKSHDSICRAETDKKKEKATSSAGILLIRWHVKTLPDRAAIQAAFVAKPAKAVAHDA
jgi:Protein of unknown function (DUF2726)